MKNRYLWLLALPYVVVQSTGNFWKDDTVVYEIKGASMRCDAPKGSHDCDFMVDWAESLNEAHERRTQKVITMEEYFKMAPCAGPNSPKSCGNWKE